MTDARLISTHAPRTGSDGNGEGFIVALVISTHAPRTGSDGTRPEQEDPMKQFQPTLPARGATGQIAALAVLTHLFQPTLPARGATTPSLYAPMDT